MVKKVNAAQRQVHRANIVAASVEIDGGNPVRALQLLEQVPPEQRRTWEWRYRVVNEAFLTGGASDPVARKGT